MRKVLMGLALAAGMGPAAQAATMQATFTGTVAGGLDASGTFLAPGTAFSGEDFRLDVIYDTALGVRPDFGSHMRLGGMGSYFPNTQDPIVQATLSIAGHSFSLTGDHDSRVFQAIYPEGQETYGVYADDGIARTHQTNEFNRLVAVIGDYSRVITEEAGRVVDHEVGVTFYNPLIVANLTREFSSDLTDTALRKYWTLPDFHLSDCSWTSGSSAVCDTDVSGALTSTALTVTLLSGTPDPDPTPSPVPLPASGALLLAALAGAGALARRRA